MCLAPSDIFFSYVSMFWDLSYYFGEYSVFMICNKKKGQVFPWISFEQIYCMYIGPELVPWTNELSMGWASSQSPYWQTSLYPIQPKRLRIFQPEVMCFAHVVEVLLFSLPLNLSAFSVFYIFTIHFAWCNSSMFVFTLACCALEMSGGQHTLTYLS